MSKEKKCECCCCELVKQLVLTLEKEFPKTVAAFKEECKAKGCCCQDDASSDTCCCKSDCC